MPSLLRDERGSLLLLQAFLIVAVVSAVTVIADVGAVIGARQQLAATADQAAVAGAQAVDLRDYYAGGAAGADGLVLDPASVAASVRRYLAPALAAGQQDGLALESVDVEAGSVTVTLSARATMPFTSMLGVPSVPVRASARAALMVQPAA